MKKKFPFNKLQINHVFYEFTHESEEQDAELELVIEFKPITIGDQELQPQLQFLGFSDPAMESAVFEGGYTFSEEELEPSSIYVEAVHNPVDLKALSIKKTATSEIIQMDLFFDFEYERTSFESKLLSYTFVLEVG